MREKILLVSSGGLDKSGVPSVLMTIVNGLNWKFSFDILLHTEDSSYYESQFLSHGGKIFRCPKRHFRFKPFDRIAEILRPMQLYRFTRKLIRDNGPYKAIHCNNDFDAAGCVAAAKTEHVPVRICHTHKSWKADSEMGILTRIYRSRCRKIILENATILAGCSESACVSTFGESADSEILLNPYDEKRYSPSLPLKQPSGLDLIQVGYFNQNKNQLFSVEILKELKALRPDVHLTFIGNRSGEYGEKVKKAVNNYGLMEAVSFMPEDSDIPKEMEKCSILLMPSEYEGFGIVLIEAQAMGLHCLASDSIPRESDRGGVVFLPLSSGAKMWADVILSNRDLTVKKVKECKQFSTNSFLRTINLLYLASTIRSN